jgi:N4-(beta-N-acetylglucosaminyl)-L-asparaginase
MQSANDLSRREFLQSSATVAASGMVAGQVSHAMAQDQRQQPPPAVRPVVISSANGLRSRTKEGHLALEVGMAMLREGRDPLDAIVEAVTVVEEDETDHSVGRGGLPNEDGIVELDSSVMHGPTHKAGAVASMRNICNAAKVARLVMQRTDHVLIVGEGALRFAKAHGFKEENLLTEKAREIWLKWKESRDRNDDWLTAQEAAAATRPADGPRSDAGAFPETTLPLGRRRGATDSIPHTWGTINCCAVDAKGDLAGVTTTSGLSWKIPGRVGDSPIIGAGLYVDNAVGAAGSTGRGEANLQNCSSFLVVELMRNGRSPEEAVLEVLRRVADHTEPRLRNRDGRPDFDLKLYALAKDGRHAGGSMWSGQDHDTKKAQYAVHDGSQGRLLDCVYLYKSP